MPPRSKSLGPSRPPRSSRFPAKNTSAEARLNLLLEASELFCIPLSANETLQALADFLVPRLADGCILSLADSSQALQPAHIAHIDDAMAGRIGALLQLASFQRAIERAFQASVSLLAERDSIGLKLPKAQKLRLAPSSDISTAMTVPLRSGHRAIGMMTLLVAEGPSYEPIDLKLVDKLASRAAIAIERARLFDFEKRSTERLRLLQSLTSGLSRALSLDDVGQLIVTELPAALGAPTAAVYLCTAKQEALGVLAERGFDLAETSEAILIDQRHPLTDAVRSGLPIWVESQADFATRYPGGRYLPGHEAALACVPLTVDDRTIGALALGFSEGRSLDDSEREFVLTVASQCAQALDRARLYSEAEQSARLRDDFLSLASHELNTPLTSLKLALGHLGRGRYEPAGLPRLLGVIERQADRLGHLVTDLLDVSRLTAGTVHLEIDEIDWVAVAKKTLSRFSKELEASGSELSFDAPESLVGRWDQRRLEQITSCLVSNAIKFGRGKPIAITVERDGQLARLSVQDQGIGIPQERQARIFDRFERAVATPHFGGFGLGLWLARRVVEAMGGDIRFESKLGLGALFHVELPLGGAS